MALWTRPFGYVELLIFRVKHTPNMIISQLSDIAFTMLFSDLFIQFIVLDGGL